MNMKLQKNLKCWLEPEGVTLDIKHIPLFHAVQRCDYRIVELLLKAGANPDIRGKTFREGLREYSEPLVLTVRQAVSDKSYGVFEKLLQYGANPLLVLPFTVVRAICRTQICGRYCSAWRLDVMEDPHREWGKS